MIPFDTAWQPVLGQCLTMAKIHFLTILLVVTCFVGGVVSVTDKEFEVSNELISNISIFFNLKNKPLTNLSFWHVFRTFHVD